jgi:hypothetical protein
MSVPIEFDYQWTRNGVNIAGATNATYPAGITMLPWAYHRSPRQSAEADTYRKKGARWLREAGGDAPAAWPQSSRARA